MNKIALISFFAFLATTSAKDYDPDVIDDSSLIPLLRAKFVKLEKPVKITVKDSNALKQAYDIIEKSCGEYESGSILTLAWCKVTLPEPKVVSLGAEKTHFDLVKAVSKALQCKVVEFDWGCILVPPAFDRKTVEAKIDFRKDQQVETLRSPFLIPISLWDIDPSYNGVGEFITEKLKENTAMRNFQHPTDFIWSPESGKPTNLFGTLESSYVGNWTYLGLIQTMCLFYSKTWEVKEGKVITIHPGDYLPKSNPVVIPHRNIDPENPF